VIKPLFFKIEQMAIVTDNVDNFVRDASLLGKDRWIIDEVVANHVFLDARIGAQILPEPVRYKIAFNYDMIPERELEVIQGVIGRSVNISSARYSNWDRDSTGSAPIAHYGYRVPNLETFEEEMQRWEAVGANVRQITLTSDHLRPNPSRYLYAFADARQSLGAHIKIVTKFPATNVPSIFELIARYAR
jgi:hypothetical protein